MEGDIMRVHVAFIPSDHEALDDGLDFDMPGVPQPGDRITIQRPGQEGSADFIVRRAHWTLEHPVCGPLPRAGAGVVGSARAVTIECEFAVGPLSSEEHKPLAAV
jgi:hypothetical protein